jgi:galactonate dehydratase
MAAMKISRLKTIVVNAEMCNWVFVKVETDVPGLYGWGEDPSEFNRQTEEFQDR